MRHRTNDNRLPATVPMILIVLLSQHSRAQESYDSSYLNQLRSKQFFALAEKYCEDEIEDEPNSPRRTQLVMELSRTLVEHGKILPQKDREATWQLAEKSLFDGAGQIPEQHLKTRLEVQNALNVSNQATFLRWQSEVTPQDSLLRQLALEQIRKAHTAIKTARNRAKSTLGETPYRRSDLRNALDLHDAFAIMDEARLEAPASVERISLASKAEEIAKRLSSTAVNNANRLEARILYAACCRERGDGAKAISILDRASEVAANSDDRSRIFAERIRMLLYEQRPDEAMQQIIAWRQKHGSLIGELHYLRMQTLVALLRVAENAKDTHLADGLLSQMQTGATYAEKEVGGYWAFRCEQLFSRTREANELGSELTKLKRQAERDYTAGNKIVAAQNFGLAAAEAEKRSKPDLAQQLFYQQGALLVQEEQLELAATAFQKSAAANGIESGREAHLMSAWCLGRLYAQKMTKSRREAYVAALTEHRELYSSGRSHADATLMLAIHEERRLQNSKAIELYRQIPAEHQSQHLKATAAMARCYARIVARLKSLKNQPLTDEWLEKAGQDLAPHIARLPPEPARLNESQTELAVYTATIMLQQNTANHQRAGELLRRGERALQSLEPTPTTKQLASVAERWKATTAITSGDSNAAMKQLGDISNRSADELMTIISSIDKAIANKPQTRLETAELRLRIGETALQKSGQLPKSKQIELAVWMVGTYLDLQKRDEAVTQATKVIDSTRDVEILSRTSARIQTVQTKSAQTVARRGWKKLETSIKAGSSTWLNARLHVAECTFALGDTKECRKLIKLTRLLYPELGGDQIKSAFIRLESRLP